MPDHDARNIYAKALEDSRADQLRRQRQSVVAWAIAGLVMVGLFYFVLSGELTIEPGRLAETVSGGASSTNN